MNTAKSDIEAYIAAFPAAVQSILKKVRQTVRKAAPDAEEVISYRMPALRMDGMIIYYAAFKGHIGLYPPVRGSEGLLKAVKKYAGPKGNLRFPFDQAIPYGLIARIVKHNVKQDVARAKLKKSLKKRPVFGSRD